MTIFLLLRTSVVKVTHVKIVHSYQLFRDGSLLAEGHSTLALRSTAMASLSPCPIN